MDGGRGGVKYIIGLTGNIATGKSVVSEMLERLGAKAIDADALVHELMEQGTPVWQAVVREFRQDILCSDGSINRKKLGSIVFADEAALRRLEAIVHPAVIARTRELIESSQEPVVVVEAIKLIEAGMDRAYDTLWVTTCRKEQQLARLVKQRGLTEEEACQRIEAQPPQEAKLALADVVIDNSGSLDETRRQVKREWERILMSNEGMSDEGTRERGNEAPSNSLSDFRLPTSDRKSATGNRKPNGREFMMSVREFISEHPRLVAWFILAVFMVPILLWAAKDVGLLPGQLAALVISTILLAGLCAWIIGWE
jgi:dephospho-CoA kinase